MVSKTNGSSSDFTLGKKVRPGDASSLDDEALAKSPPGARDDEPRWGRGRRGIGGILLRDDPDVEGVGRRLGAGAY